MSYESKYFDRAEMACKCGCGTYNVSEVLLERLDVLRDAMQRPLIVESGCRCIDHNRAERGKENSAHITMIGRSCRAVDIVAGTGREKFYLLMEALKLGFERIGIGRTFIHLDVADDLPRPNVWTY